MELKEFRQYTQEEKGNLLFHWFQYYGKLICSFDEIDRFVAMIDEDSDKVMMLAVMAFMDGMTSQPIIGAMRAGKLEEVMASVPVFETKDENWKQRYLAEERRLLSRIVATYNNPEPSVPMIPEVMERQVLDMISKNKDKQ